MRGQVFTPKHIVDQMVEKLFKRREPRPDDVVLDPGCGDGAFIEGILRWCNKRGIKPPKIIGIELDPDLIEICKERFSNYENVVLLQQDFLISRDLGYYDFIIGNPPYVRIEKLSESERETYRRLFETAVGRFDLYILFFEKALKHLALGGRLVFITPEKFLYTWTAAPLRRLMAKFYVEEIELIEEDTFKELLTYPTITTINKMMKPPFPPTRVILRDGSSLLIELPSDGSSWLSVIYMKGDHVKKRHTLEEICDRISCGVATGENRVFIISRRNLPESLKSLAWPTISGRELGKFPPGISIEEGKLIHVMIVPYDESGKLLSGDRLKDFLKWLTPHKEKLEERYCVKKGKKKWYEFHETPPMRDLLRPKILVRDITKEPTFWIDEKGIIIPQHNVYYLVPKNSNIIPRLIEYLNSDEVKGWLAANCQRAANGYLRIQSSILKKLPIPDALYNECLKKGRDSIWAFV